MMSFIEIVKPGGLSHIQDRGRTGFEYLGLSRCGPLDFRLFAMAQTLVGNSLDDAAIEMTYQGLDFLSPHDPVIFSVAGVQDIRIGSCIHPARTTLEAGPGQRVSIGRLTGQRAYLAVRGGFDTPRVLGSRSTDFTAGIGGWQGRSLRAGDEIPVKAPPPHRIPAFDMLPDDTPDCDSPLHVVVGPDTGEFPPEAVNTFLKAEYAFTSASNLMGIRLSGPPIKPRDEAASKVSRGMVPGSIQVPPDGQPIILLNQRGTIGGYPVVATLLSPELWRLAQWPSSKKLSFVALSPAKAQAYSHGIYRRLMAWCEGVVGQS
ncbi:MAG: hypothetical protein C7B43_01230 [Sulfobacillus benefaciens]|jgi:biotin-dependent carboxylase-like uncharacterized protein|uniref:Carboxyltransferase domain-containing protein n=1 Tax=Sulfobacillus benefaciens TaxID=453960 RepID=A0A2T2XBH1_9FIRM|nr:MAG: hypothetical protein C7B43_01230 [Sulfobacillus benefaciens]